MQVDIYILQHYEGEAAASMPRKRHVDCSIKGGLFH